MVSLDVLALDTSGRVIILSLIIQELVYERPYMVLPPLIEWLRVTVGKIFFNELQIFLRNTGLLRQVVFCEARLGAVLDQDDVYQAARILLPPTWFCCSLLQRVRAGENGTGRPHACR